MTNAGGEERVAASSAQRLRSRSKAAFGNQDRLEVAAAVARASGGLVNATQLAAEIGMVNTRVRAQLMALVDAGLLKGSLTSDRVRWYERRESAFWALVAELHDEWLNDG